MSKPFRSRLKRISVYVYIGPYAKKMSTMTPTSSYEYCSMADLGLHPASERRRYFVTTSLIGWVQA